MRVSSVFLDEKRNSKILELRFWHVIIPQRSCLTTQPVVAQRTTGRLPESPTQTLKGFHNTAVCRTLSAFIDLSLIHI